MPWQSHRACGRKWEDLVVVSVYGDAHQADLEHVLEISRAAEEMQGTTTVLCGDFNWRPAYEMLLDGGWRASEVVPTTKGGVAAPTRCLVRSQVDEAMGVTTEDLPGVPHHRAVTYTLPRAAPDKKQERRLKRCAKYAWLCQLSEEQREDLRQRTEGAVPRELDCTLERQWANWHQGAEALYKLASHSEWAVVVKGRLKGRKAPNLSRWTCVGGKGCTVLQSRALGRAAEAMLWISTRSDTG